MVWQSRGKLKGGIYKMNYIYCYTNKINQHKYIGQTNNLQRRIREHKSCAFNSNSSSYNDLIHKKIREYGIENFDIEVIEIIYNQDQEYINEREKYWIKEKSSFRGTGLGYNSDLGGNKSGYSMFTMDEINSIKEKIKQGVSFLDLELEYKISASYLSNINHGIYFFDDKENYPLYQYYKKDTDYDELIDLLLNSPMRMSDIAKQLNIGYSTVKKINAGTLRKGLYPTYPIRKISANEMRANKIKDLLLHSNYSKTEISKLLNVDLETIRRINIGQCFNDKQLQYPLRNL